ncbi:HAD hydrolase-like protein [Candidatus Pacearchaeota archaeon]|nr:HAD hydrolase-like protein [Candidatus Pacearchaeota archaeon]MBD3283551.1 HAD hydrolase-like protein [Candidatus Pacearchaeota archaeon]
MKEQKTSALVFDLDNTLINSKQKYERDVTEAFARLGYTVTPDQLGVNWYDFAESYGIPKQEFDESLDKRKTWEQSLADGEVLIFPETHKVLTELSGRGIRLSLLSKSNPEYTQTKLDYFDLGRYFEFVETIHPKRPSKDTAAIELVKKMKPETLRHIQFVGDREEDITCEQAVRDAFSGYALTTGGIYVGRQGQQLQGYPSVRSLEEILERL